MEQVLLLNITYEPLKIINWKKAITLLLLDKVEVIEEYNKEIHSISFTIKLPAVVRLLKFIKRVNNKVKFSRQNIYTRDKNKCQYCGKELPLQDLTYDHVIPKSRGGTTSWGNIATCCIKCNRKKGGRTPKEARMNLLKKPNRPNWLPAFQIAIRFKEIPQSWRDYLYWNIELLE